MVEIEKKDGRSPADAGSGHSPKGGAAISVASPAKPSVPNAEGCAQRPHLLEFYCRERCAEFGDPPCSVVDPDNKYCADCIEDADLALAAFDYASAMSASGRDPEEGREAKGASHD